MRIFGAVVVCDDKIRHWRTGANGTHAGWRLLPNCWMYTPADARFHENGVCTGETDESLVDCLQCLCARHPQW